MNCNRLAGCINNLYDVIVEAGRDGLPNPDGVYFNKEGCRLLGVATTNKIRECFL